VTFAEYASATSLHEMAVIDRALHCLYWLQKNEAQQEASIRNIADLLIQANLPMPNVTRLAQLFKSSRRVIRAKSKGYFKLHPAATEELERAVGYLFAPSATPPRSFPTPAEVPFFSQAEVALSRDMSEIYVYLFCIENSARNLIRSILEAAHGVDWWSQVRTRDMEKKVQDRTKEEQRNKWHQPRGRHPLNYLDFGDLKDLICNNWPYFKSIFPDQHWVVARLTELEKSRNVIAHNNVLGDIEIGRIRLYFGDWCRQVSGIV
jgi:hypothetical protein